MIPRKRLQVLLYTLYVSFVFGDEGTNASTITDIKTSNSAETTEPFEYGNTILTEDNSKTVNYVTQANLLSNLSIDLRNTIEENVTESATLSDVSLSTNSAAETTEPFEYGNTILTEDNSKTVNYVTQAVLLSNLSIDLRNTIEENVTESTTLSDVSLSTNSAADCNDPDNGGNVTNLYLTNSTSSSLSVAWSDTRSCDCVSLYAITWYKTDATLEYENGSLDLPCLNSSSEYTVPGLDPCTSYTVCITVIWKEENENENNTECVSNTTDTTEISVVKSLTVAEVEYGLNVTWEAPVEANCVSFYRVNTWSDTQTTTPTVTDETNDTFLSLTNLEACIDYMVEVIPVNEKNQNGQSATTTGTATAVPGVVLNLNLSSITGDTAKLTWDAPTTNPTCVNYYSVKTCQGSDCTTASTTNTSYSATGLSPCLEYTFSVTSVGSSGESDPSDATGETSYVSPGIVQSLSASPGNFSLNVTWGPPSTGTTCIKNYRVTVWNVSTESTENTYIVMSDLYACTSYTIQVTPVSKTSGDGDFDTVTESTLESVTDPPEVNVEPTVTKSSISIGWRVESYMNNCDLQSVITICEATGSNGTGYELVDGQSTDSLTKGLNVTATINVTDLSPFTNYTCRGITVNSAGNSSQGSAVYATTSEDIPSSPALTVESITDSEFTFSWAKPTYLPGYLKHYEIVFSSTPMFLIPGWCSSPMTTSITVNDILGTDLSHTYESGAAYSNYSSGIRAKTGAGWGTFSDPVVFQTEAGVPGEITNLTYTNTTNAVDSNVLDTTLKWSLPCSLNGVIEYFSINVYGTRAQYSNHSITNTFYATGEIDANESFKLEFGELRAEYDYVFEVSAKVANVSRLGPLTNYTVTYPAGIPPLPNASYIESITIDPYKIKRSGSTAHILLPLFENDNGNIQYYAIMISEKGYGSPERLRLDVKGGDWPNTTAWLEAMSYDYVLLYQATAVKWNLTNYVTDYGHMKVVNYVLGDDSNCKELSANINTKLYCNGPLKSDTWYHVWMRAFTNGGYADSGPFIVKTDSELNVALVIGVVFGILFLGIATTMMLLVRRRGIVQTIVQKLNCSDVPPASPFLAPLTRTKFIAHCQQLADNPGRLSNEYQLLQTLSSDLQMATYDASLQANRKKNRYTDILPYDFSRVKLDIMDNDPNTDYINASFVNGYSGEVEYIACQGPKEETTYDFWRMIDKYNVKVIVMVTQLVEKGKEKCHQYYPELGNTFEYEDMAIRCSSNLDHGAYRRRTFVLQKNDAKRNILHLHFKEWPDHDVPDDYNSMIEFCELVRKQIEANKTLAVIHCSAGVGRTGTLIAIDILLQQIRENRKLDVFGTVYRLRRYRVNMVQRESQYAYIYNCTRQALINPDLLNRYKPPPVDPTYENLPLKNKNDWLHSNENLVNSMETLKKSSPSTSVDSMQPIYEATSPRPSFRSQISTLSNGLKYTRSMGALDGRPSKIQRIVKYGSQDFSSDEPGRSSVSSNEQDDLHGSRNAIYENLPTLARSRSTHITRNVYPYNTQKSVQDTSI